MYCSLDEKIYLDFDKRHGADKYTLSEKHRNDTIDTLMRIARYRVPQERCIRIEFLELPFPKDAINR